MKLIKLKKKYRWNKTLAFAKFVKIIVWENVIVTKKANEYLSLWKYPKKCYYLDAT